MSVPTDPAVSAPRRSDVLEPTSTLHHPGSAGVTVDVRYFAVLRERRGCDREQVVVLPGTTVRELYRALCPPLPEGELPVMFAVNRDYVPPGAPLQDGDEVAFIPPLGGG